MSDSTEPMDVPITERDFHSCGWQVVLAAATQGGYPSMSQAFSATARQAAEDGHGAREKVFRLLADTCSMMLSPRSINEPFKPYMVIEGKRSAIPDDLTEIDVQLFAQIVESVDDPWLRARLADLVWLKGSKRDARFALIAIDAYRKIPLDPDTWVRGGQVCWPRAIQLARMVGRGAGDRLAEIEAAVRMAFDTASQDDGFLALWLADLMESHDLGQSARAVVAEKLERLAIQFDAVGDLHGAGEFFDASSRWFRLEGDVSRAAATTAAKAEACVKQAEGRLTSQSPSYMAAVHFFEDAIQIYRTIPRSERGALNVDERIDELRKRLGEAGEKSLSEMQVVSSPGIDISELVEAARKAVSGKNAVEALRAFCSLHRGVDVKKSRASAVERVRAHPLTSLFSASVLSTDGRVIARRPGISSVAGAFGEDDPTIRAEMIRDYGLLIGIVVQGDILPALETLWLEHRLRENDFVALANQSPLIPKDRVRLFGKALFGGYDRDFITALHLLVPQVEHLVRYHLKQVGAKTTSLDREGIENEVGLSGLMDLPETEKVFGPDLSFEIRALFCDPFGPNLRNQLAHGLLGDEACQSVYSIYAWWFALKLTFNAFWNATEKPEPSTD